VSASYYHISVFFVLQKLKKIVCFKESCDFLVRSVVLLLMSFIFTADFDLVRCDTIDTSDPVVTGCRKKHRVHTTMTSCIVEAWQIIFWSLSIAQSHHMRFWTLIAIYRLIAITCESIVSDTWVSDTMDSQVIAIRQWSDSNSGVVLEIEVGIRCKQCGRGTEVERCRREYWGAEGVEGGVVWGGGVPLPTGWEVWGGGTEKFLLLALKMVRFGAFWFEFLLLSCLR